jgi:hypothetical protein
MFPGSEVKKPGNPTVQDICQQRSISGQIEKIVEYLLDSFYL